MGIQFGILNFFMGNPASMNDLNWKHKEISEARYRANIFHINADQMVLAYLHYGDSVFKGRYNIGYWHWELSDFPDEWEKSFNLIDEVWVPTDFVLEAISKKSPVPVIKIPHGIEVKCSLGQRRDIFKLPVSSFLFLAMYDIQSIQERKNPRAVIEAFKNAFSKEDTSAALIIKVNNSKDDPMHLDKLREEVRDYKNVYLLEGNMNRHQVNDLLNSVDCYISLHRSEGFGLGLAEAMYLGKPVIGTNWSGNTDFMNPSNSCLVDYKLIGIPRDYGPYKAGQVWAEPDIEQASYFMRKLVSDPVWRKELALRGQETIFTNYSPRAVGEQAKQRLISLSLL
ncbi:glycosyltransferase family 4 protein [Phosphitispora sp. TUW77]|uniref:glycosyltransferase family 4 protein n=1 Tax=Phosphitispora sp. TUW77 TaxID=3152361 RepID=UPI003AB32ED8